MIENNPETNEQEQEQQAQQPVNPWSKYFPEIKEEDMRYDIKVNLQKLRNRSRISAGVDMDQLEDFVYWLYGHSSETPIRFTTMNPYEYFLQLLSQRIA